MEILEILMNLDYLEFSKSFQEEIQNSIKTGKIFNKKGEPVSFREKFHNYLNTNQIKQRRTTIRVHCAAELLTIRRTLKPRGGPGVLCRNKPMSGLSIGERI